MPRLAERAFVLDPLSDLAPAMRHPILDQTVYELWTALQVPHLPKVLPIGDRIWRPDKKTYIMGIINITPDSFSGDGILDPNHDGYEHAAEKAVAQARRFVAEGADCLDVGGQSTRPGHTLEPVAIELARIVPVISALSAEFDLPISVDTFRSPVAEAALASGADLINDVWAMRFDPAIGDITARAFVPLVVMHNSMRHLDPAYPKELQSLRVPNATDADLMADLWQIITPSLDIATQAGLPRWLQIVDPGIGFGTTMAQNLAIIRHMDQWAAHGYPILFGPSRKRFIGKILGDLPPEERDEGTLTACILAAERGANILRVHNVRSVARAAKFLDAFQHS